MSITVSLVEYVADLIAALGLAGVLALTALELLIAPIPGEAIMAFAGFLISSGRFGFAEVLLAGATGNLLGSLISYWIGLKLGRPALLRVGKYLGFSERDLKAAEDFFQRRGSLAVLAGRLVPGLRSVISFPAGIAKMDLQLFIVFTLLGSAVWNALFIYIGFLLGERWSEITAYSEYLDAAGVAVLALLGVYLAWRLFEDRLFQSSRRSA